MLQDQVGSTAERKVQGISDFLEKWYLQEENERRGRYLRMNAEFENCIADGIGNNIPVLINKHPKTPEEGIRIHRPGATSGCELQGTGAGS